MMESRDINERSETKDGVDKPSEEVQFVSECRERPVVAYIDLSEYEDDAEPASTSYSGVMRTYDPIEDSKKKVESTLGRLSKQVQQEKEMIRARSQDFQVRTESIRAHGLQQLKLAEKSAAREEAKYCIGVWLNTPGRQNPHDSIARRGCKLHPQVQQPDTLLVCPIVNCNRRFDNMFLLQGHMKRFDHSPCDPTAMLGLLNEQHFGCVMCYKVFANYQDYTNHLITESCAGTDTQQADTPPLSIHCFACPSCFYLFNSRKACLDHMAAVSHNHHAVDLSEDEAMAAPLPFPKVARDKLEELCRAVPFMVNCSNCACALTSHSQVCSHLKYKCPTGTPVALAGKAPADVAAVFRKRGSCWTCRQLFSDLPSCFEHAEAKQHTIRYMLTTLESLQEFSHVSGLPVADKETAASETKTENLCRCGLSFCSEEELYTHVLQASELCFHCHICSLKSKTESVLKIHMSRIHGGAFLGHYSAFCHSCGMWLEAVQGVIQEHLYNWHTGHGLTTDNGNAKKRDREEYLEREEQWHKRTHTSNDAVLAPRFSSFSSSDDEDLQEAICRSITDQ
uniref:E3 SUMO-protein ligase ZNF451 n=1 Tax=Myxine glutinosa TaxID=7769 RepID=UPI00358EEE59